jgi:hypothetical protein
MSNSVLSRTLASRTLVCLMRSLASEIRSCRQESTLPMPTDLPKMTVLRLQMGHRLGRMKKRKNKISREEEALSGGNSTIASGSTPSSSSWRTLSMSLTDSKNFRMSKCAGSRLSCILLESNRQRNYNKRKPISMTMQVLSSRLKRMSLLPMELQGLPAASSWIPWIKRNLLSVWHQMSWR